MGIQTALVTGPENEVVYTDEMGRIKIQFHWQRSKEHPVFAANFDENSSCWLRVAYPGAGDDYGYQNIPRIGQEVLVDFIEGDIDRPAIVGVIHNGRQPNPWFSDVGSLPANRALTGIKTEEHHGQQYNELLFDDTTGQVRTKLSSEHGKTQLNQGFLTHPRQDGEAEPRGEGFELRTDQHGALRAGQGLLLSTEAKPNAQGKQLDRENAQAQLNAGQKLAETLSHIAQSQQAAPTETGPETLDEEGKTEEQKSATGHLAHLVKATHAWEAGTNTDREGQNASGQPGKQAILLASAVDGMGLVSAQEMALIAGQNLDTITHRDTQQTTARRWIHNVGSKISLFVNGIADKVNLKLITAKGHAQLHAQSGDIEVTGDKSLRIVAKKKKLIISAGKELVLNCGGATIRMEGGNIEILAPGVASLKGGTHSFSGPASMNPEHPSFPETKPMIPIPLTINVGRSSRSSASTWGGMPYKLTANGGFVQEGVLDEDGNLHIEHNPAISQYKLEMANGAKFDIPVANEHTNPTQGELAVKSFRKNGPGAAPKDGCAEPESTLRERFAALLNPTKSQGD
jgi:type VI secretion system secreted protein VgrG